MSFQHPCYIWYGLGSSSWICSSLGIKACVWGRLGLRRGLAPVCWQERACWELLCSWRAVGFPGWDSPQKSALLSHAWPEMLSYPFLCSFCWPGSRDELRSHRLAAFGNQLGHPPPEPSQGAGAGSVGSAGSSAAPLTLHPSPGLLQAPPARPALLWHQGELWVLPLCR